MAIFKTYTGNAMLNNALMTIEALAELDSVSDISPSIIKKTYEKVDLKELNKRLKSYSMVFSLNNPLVNPAKKANRAGEITYHSLLNAILDDFENTGKNICEISGLRFDKAFEDFYKDELERQKKALAKSGLDSKELKKLTSNIDKTDTSLNRSWFPLIGGLGSDAQALPQAKFSIKVHPICIPILQFLPLSALLYRGGILLIDSSNFSWAREIIAAHVGIVKDKIQAVSSDKPIENIRDFAKGDYLLKGLEILSEKEEMEESYSDLNMWSFSNSGTGASCFIDRVPDRLIKKLKVFIEDPKLNVELKSILKTNELAYSFLECLEDNRDWHLLYPNVFGAGKKKVEHPGYSVDFLETYYSLIGHQSSTSHAKYIAGLIKKYQSNKLAELLEKTDSWKDAQYRIELLGVLIKATKSNEWNLQQQISILDDNDSLPARNSFFKLHRLIHFYYQKNVFVGSKPAATEQSLVHDACRWLISLIQNDARRERIIADLLAPNENSKVRYEALILRQLPALEVGIEGIVGLFFDEGYNYRRLGTNELMRIFFSQPKQQEYQLERVEIDRTDRDLILSWSSRLSEFANDYFRYYSEKHSNKLTGELPLKKYSRLIDSMIAEREKFADVLNEAIQNTNSYLNEQRLYRGDKWNRDDIFIDPSGKESYSLGSFAIKFVLKEQSINLLKNNKQSLWQN